MKILKINPHLIFVPELQINDIIEVGTNEELVVVGTFKQGRLVTRTLVTKQPVNVPCEATTRVRKLGYLVNQE